MAKSVVADIIGDRIRKAVAGALSDAQSELDQIAKDGGKEAATGIVGDVGRLSQIITDLALAAVVLDPPVGLGIEAIREAEKQGGKIGIGSALGYMMGYTAFQALNPLFMPLQHAIAHELTNEIHDPTTSAQLVARGLFTHDHGVQEASGNAIDSDHFNRLVSLAQNRPDVATALELHRRGVWSKSFLLGELRHLGYDEQATADLFELTRNLLSPADLALAELRGVITREQALAYLPHTGLSETDYDTLIGNTGEPPGTEELLFAYRRGFIDQAQLERGIRQSRVRNEWIPTIEKLRHTPMSTADAVRAVVENYITPAEGGRIAEQNGLTPEHWPILHESWGRPLAHMEMGSLVHRGLASRRQFDQAMRESDIKDKYIEQSFEVTQRLLPERLIVSAIHYKAISLKDGAKQLLELGYTRQRAAILLKLGLHEQQGAAHELTRTNITSLYQDGVLSREQAHQHLVSLGYSAQNADYLLALIDAQMHGKEVKAEVSVIRGNFLAGGITEIEAGNELHALGMTAAQERHQLQVWNRERRRASRNLTEAQVVKAAKEATIAPPEAIDLLTALGYSRDNARVLLISNGVPVGPTTP